MDIATSAILSQVSKRCKSLKFVILIYCASLLEDRGGAFCSVLNFVRTFVRDFQESKRSFVFLFTHSDDITGMSSSLSDACKRLQEEIILMGKGTSGPRGNVTQDVLSVLSFIHKCLKKGHPSADIFHPLHMDFSRFANFVNGMAKLNNLTFASVCNLTPSSKFRLQAAVQHLLHELQDSFVQTPVDVSRVNEIKEQFQFLGTYIKVDSISNGSKDCDNIIKFHIAALEERIEDEGIINKVHRDLNTDILSEERSIQECAKCIKTLVDAKMDLHDLMIGRLNFDSEIAKIESAASTILCSAMARLQSAMKRNDFYLLIVNERRATLFCQYMHEFLSEASLNDFDAVAKSSKAAVESVPTYLDSFFASYFVSAKNLADSLSSLKRASEVDPDTSDPRLVAIYEEMKNGLASKSREFILNVKTAVKKGQCFDDVMPLTLALNRHLNGSLKAHALSDVLIECDSLVDYLRNEKNEYDRQHDFQGRDYEQMFSIHAQALDRLAAFSLKDYIPFLTSAKKATYENLCTRLHRQIEKFSIQAQESLNARDHISVQDSIKILEYADRKIGRHIKMTSSLASLRSLCVETIEVSFFTSLAFLHHGKGEINSSWSIRCFMNQ